MLKFKLQTVDKLLDVIETIIKEEHPEAERISLFRTVDDGYTTITAVKDDGDDIVFVLNATKMREGSDWRE